MGKNHLTRLAAPKSWQIKRKGLKFITKALPGPHSLDTGISFNTMFIEILNYAKTAREVKKIFQHK